MTDSGARTGDVYIAAEGGCGEGAGSPSVEDFHAESARETKKRRFEEALGAGARREPEAGADVEGWDVVRGPRKEGRWSRLTMVPPLVARMAASTVGSSLAMAGYGVGKVVEFAGAGRAIDSRAFHASGWMWLWSNGIFPTVHYEPLGRAGAELAARYRMSRDPKAEQMSLTPIILSNHTSYLDGLILGIVFGAPKIVAKAGCARVPVVGRLLQECGTVFVERGEKGSRQATLDAIAGHCEAWRPGQRPLLIFPEGTTTNGEGMLDFKKGAFIGGLPVRPVLIVYTGQFDPANTSYKMTEKGPVKTSDAEWVAQFMGHFIHSIHVRVLAPYLPDKAERADPELFAGNCRRHMAAELARVREELRRTSWREAAGREGGRLGSKFGDATRALWTTACGA